MGYGKWQSGYRMCDSKIENSFLALFYFVRVHFVLPRDFCGCEHVTHGGMCVLYVFAWNRLRMIAECVKRELDMKQMDWFQIFMT